MSCPTKSADGALDAARKSIEWELDGDRWVRGHGDLRIVVYPLHGRGWYWCVRVRGKALDLGFERTAAYAKAVAIEIEIAARIAGGAT